MGIPFYGYKDGQAVVSHDVINLLESQKVKIAWDDVGKEHIFR